MTNFIKDLQVLLKLAHKHLGLLILGGITALLTLPLWLWFIAPEHPLMNSYWHTTEFKVKPSKKEEEYLQKILTDLLIENDADLVAVAYYLMDNDNILYIAIGEQTQRGAVSPILNAKYYLITPQLWQRYKAHRDRQCFLTYFDLSGTWSISCGFYYKTELIGYITVEFKAKPSDSSQVKVIETLRIAANQIEQTMGSFLEKISKSN